MKIVNGGSSELTSTQERVWNAKRPSNPFAMIKFFGAKTYGLEKIPNITFGGRASPSEMLDLLFQMSQKITEMKPTEEAVIQAQKETVELLLMMYQELTVDVWQHIYFTAQTNPYVGQDKIKNVEMVSSYMPYGYDHTSKTLKIYDAAKKTYSVANYQLAYKKTGIREDEITGKLIPTSTLSYQLFTETPVSPIWIKTIRAQIKSGDELYFFEVVAKDEKGRVMYSSNLKLTIK